MNSDTTPRAEREAFDAWNNSRPSGPLAGLQRQAAFEVWVLKAVPLQEPARRWPFVETPGEFTERLRAALDEFGALLPAVRYVLIETPPTLAAPSLKAAQCPLCAEYGRQMMKCGHCGGEYVPEELHDANLAASLKAPLQEPADLIQRLRDIAHGMASTTNQATLREAADALAAPSQAAPAIAERIAELEKRDSEAANHVEAVICLRTKFTGRPPYVGWKGLGLALTEALDERDALREALAAPLDALPDELDNYKGLARDLALLFVCHRGSGFQPIEQLKKLAEEGEATVANAYAHHGLEQPKERHLTKAERAAISESLRKDQA